MEKIDNIKLLNENDKNILKSFKGDYNKLKDMSIFSKEGTYDFLEDYCYFKTNNDINIYYISRLSLFIDENKKILFDSRYYFYLFTHFINHLDMILNVINTIDLNNKDIIDIGSNIISIEKWFMTYGHYKDEAYNLCDFKNKLKVTYTRTKINYKVLIDYKNEKNKNYNTTNYEIIQKYLFDNSAINASEHNIIKMRNINLIKHNNGDKTFHNFPLYSRNLILSKIEMKNYDYEKVFITRGIALHLPRNLLNEEEINNILISKNFFVVNPELETLDNFINIIKNAKTIVLTWGGTLVNMVYLKPNTKVYILKSESYQDEKIDLFMKIIENYNLKIDIITHINNKIPINKLEEIN